MLLITIAQNYTSEATALHALSEYLRMRGIDMPFDVKYAHEDNGKPYFEGYNGVYVSLSHSGKYVVAGISDSELGIDIQEIRPVDYTAIGSRFGFDANTDTEFYRAFCVSEAYTKATGENLFFSLKKVAEIMPHATVFNFIPGYVLALYSASDDTPMFYFKVR